MSAFTAAHEIMWLAKYLNDLNLEQNQPKIDYEDSQSAIKNN